MSNHQSQLSQQAVSLTQAQQAVLARKLIEANEHYRQSNSAEMDLDTREYHRLQAQMLAEEVAGQAPDNAAALNLLGRICMDNGELDDAAGYLLAAIELAPANANYYINLAYVRLATRDYDQAEALFSKALELQPDNAQAYGGVALAYLRRQDYLGAFLRLRSLISKGYAPAYCRKALFDAAQNLWADRYDAELDQDLQEYFTWTEMDAFQLGYLTCSLLVHKYNLGSNPALDLDVLAQDQLLRIALQRSLLPNHLVENMLTQLRLSILVEVFETRNLRDSLQPLVCALAQYAARTGYAFAFKQDEQILLNELHLDLQESLSKRDWRHGDVIGALLLVAMYEPLYSQPYAFHLLRDDLADWPVAAQPVLQAALHDLAEQHLVEHELKGGRTVEELAATPVVRGAAPKWETLGAHPQTDYRQALARELGGNYLPEPVNDQPLRILVTGCRSGQRAISLARFFANVEVAAVDPNPDNVVCAIQASRRYQLHNMSFACLQVNELQPGDEGFQVIECGTALGYPEQIVSNMRHLTQLLSPEGVIRFTFPRRAGRLEIEDARASLMHNNILATPDNVRAMRQVIMEEAALGLWQDIVANPDFYTLAGTRDLLFALDEPAFNLQEIQQMLNEAGLEFLGFVDLDPTSRQRVQALNPKDLLAWHALDESPMSPFHGSYEIYCRKAV